MVEERAKSLIRIFAQNIVDGNWPHDNVPGKLAESIDVEVERIKAEKEEENEKEPI